MYAQYDYDCMPNTTQVTRDVNKTATPIKVSQAGGQPTLHNPHIVHLPALNVTSTALTVGSPVPFTRRWWLPEDTERWSDGDILSHSHHLSFPISCYSLSRKSRASFAGLVFGWIVSLTICLLTGAFSPYIFNVIMNTFGFTSTTSFLLSVPFILF